MKREWLINARKKLKLSQKDIANMLNISQSTYATYELGTRIPKPKIAIKISQVLNVKWEMFYIENIEE